MNIAELEKEKALKAGAIKNAETQTQETPAEEKDNVLGWGKLDVPKSPTQPEKQIEARGKYPHERVKEWANNTYQNLRTKYDEANAPKLQEEGETPYDPTSEMGKDEKKVYNETHQTQPDLTKTVNETGEKTKEAMEDVIPHNSVKTWKDIFTDPQFEGKRGSYLLDTLGGVLSAAGTGQGQSTAMNRMNRTLEDNYASNIADRDTRAMNAQLEGLEAANAQQVALETNLADTMANTYIQRYKAAQDAKTKREVLNQLIEDSDELFNSVFKGEDGEEKLFNLASLMGLYAGDFSLSQRLIQKYAPQLLEKFDAWLEGKGFGSDGDPKKKDTVTSEPMQSPGGTYTIDPQDVVDNPDKYIEIPLSMGKTMIVKRWGTYLEDGKINIGLPKEEIDAVEDALMNNANLEDSERLAIALDWAGKGRAGVTEWEMKQKMKTRDENAKAAADAEDAQKKKEEMFLTSVQNIYKSDQKPQEKLDALSKLNTDGITNPIALNLYDTIAKENNTKVAMSKKGAIETDDSLDSGGKAKQMRSLLETYGQYMSPAEIGEINKKIQDYDYLYTTIDPYQKKADEYIRKTSTEQTDRVGGAKWVTLDKDGNFVHNSNKTQGSTVVNPSTENFKNRDGTQYVQLMLDLSSPESLMNMMPGETTEEKQENFKNTVEYKIMAKLLNNKTLEESANEEETWGKRKGEYKNENLYLAYNSLKVRFNKILNGTLF